MSVPHGAQTAIWSIMGGCWVRETGSHDRADHGRDEERLGYCVEGVVAEEGEQVEAPHYVGHSAFAEGGDEDLRLDADVEEGHC